MSKLSTALGDSNPRDLVAKMIERGMMSRAKDDLAQAGDQWVKKKRMGKGRKRAPKL